MSEILKPAIRSDGAVPCVERDRAHIYKSDRPVFSAGKAWEAAMAVVQVLKAYGASRIQVAGSLRRERARVHDVDILCIGPSDRITAALVRLAPAIWAGPDKASFMWPMPDGPAIQVDVRFIAPESWGACLQHFTGSFEHNVSLRRIAMQRGLKANEYGIFRDTIRIDDGTEAGYYRALGLRWLPPRFRNGYIRRKAHPRDTTKDRKSVV